MKLFFEKIHRGLIRVSGNEIHEFLQGLITNDISHIRHTLDCDNAMFTMFLNKQGRVLYDTIIYKQRKEKTSCLIECDQRIEEELKQHLMRFRLRKNINIDIMTQDMNIWACFQKNDRTKLEHHNGNSKQNFPPNPQHKYCNLGITVCSDPRNLLGLRMITPCSLEIQNFQYIYDNIECFVSDTYDYKKHRYFHGVCEGIMEIPPAKLFPFEVNCDYLHGISFHKGCYLGQEFTARTYHTGVIRKRIMPLLIPGNRCKHTSSLLNYDEPIFNENDQVIGKLKGVQNEFGIGLMKIDLALSSKYLKIGNLIASTYRPIWWPKKLT